MMGEQKQERELFSYAVNLEKRVRSDHPLRRVAAAIDFGFVREEVAHCYGGKGNVSVDPVIVMKMMLLLFWDGESGSALASCRIRKSTVACYSLCTMQALTLVNFAQPTG